jgi:hypothetical protein
MNPHTFARYCITGELGFAGREEGNVLVDQKRCRDRLHLSGIAPEAWGA